MKNKHYYQIIKIERKDKCPEGLQAILTYEGDDLVAWHFTASQQEIKQHAHEYTLLGADYAPTTDIGREIYTSLSLEQLTSLADICFCEVLNYNEVWGIIVKGSPYALDQLQMLLDYSSMVRDGTYKMYEVAEGCNFEINITADVDELSLALQALAMMMPDNIQVSRVSSLCYSLHILINNASPAHQDMLDALGFSEN